jgi:ATP-dependent DNA ligase
VPGSGLKVQPPVEPMLAKLGDELPVGEYLYEPKWDGFRAIVFRREDDVYIQSRDARPLDRYFPELHDVLLNRLPKNCVVDGAIVIATAHGLDFDALQLRLHPEYVLQIDPDSCPYWAGPHTCPPAIGILNVEEFGRHRLLVN